LITGIARSMMASMMALVTIEPSHDCLGMVPAMLKTAEDRGSMSSAEDSKDDMIVLSEDIRD
jgi:hypothetical protein